MTSRSARSATLLPAALALLATGAPALAHAHTGSGLGLGFAHPWSGLDHVCAMLAVGLWAGQRGGRAALAIPLAFLALVACGGALAAAGVQLPGVETGIVLSVLVLGVLIAAAVRLPGLASALLVGGFALFHGHAHGHELAAGVSGAAQMAGFLAATALLHALGFAVASTVQHAGAAPLVRMSGAAIALCGVWLLWGAAA